MPNLSSKANGRNLFILDRNIVDIIKKFNNGKKISDQKKIEKLNYLMLIDQPNSLVTPALSMIEGQRGRKETRNEKAEILEKETSEIDLFFRRAKTDRSVMQDMAGEFVDVFSEHAEQDWEEAENFLLQACPLVAENIAEKERDSVREKIFSLASAYKLPASHLATVLCIACLYGSSAARKMIKPNRIQKEIHNVMSDIYVLPRINLIKAIFKQLGIHDIETTYVTCDEGLEKVLGYIDVLNISSLENSSGVQQQIQYRKALFPSLDKKGYFRLTEEIAKR